MNSVTTLSAECGRGLVRAMLRVEHRVPGFPAVARFLERLAGTVIGQGRDGDAKPRALARSRIREWNEANPRAVIGRIRLPDRDTRRAGHLVRDVDLLPVARSRVIRRHAHTFVADGTRPLGGQRAGVDNVRAATRTGCPLSRRRPNLRSRMRAAESSSRTCTRWESFERSQRHRAAVERAQSRPQPRGRARAGGYSSLEWVYR